jgi:hypothetical protein
LPLSRRRLPHLLLCQEARNYTLRFTRHAQKVKREANMSTELRTCKICGCTEEHACMTDNGPCSWAFETGKGSVCTACIVELPPDPGRSQYPDLHVLVEKVCLNCGHLISERIRGEDCFTCKKGHFDGQAEPHEWRAQGYHHWFARSGIKQPNKTVTTARRNCDEWELHPRWRPQ